MRHWLAGLLLAAAFTNAAQLSYTANGTGAAKRSLASKLSDVVSVKDFGATGDGVTDDTAAVQAAITAACANNASAFVPPGTYKISSTITGCSSITIQGAGRLSILQPTISDGSAVLSFPAGSLNFLVADLAIASTLNGTNFNAGSATAQQCIGLKVVSVNPTFSSRFALRNVHVFGVKTAFDIQGFVATADNLWAEYSEVGLKCDTCNSVDLNLRLENNRQDLAITNSNVVLLRQIVAEGSNTLTVASTIDSSASVTLISPYYEGSALAARTVPYLTVGGSSSVTGFRIVGGRMVGSTGFTTGVYPLSLDQVVGADINLRVEDGAQERQVSTTANTTDYRLTGSAATGWPQDSSAQIDPAFNYWPNRRFDLWFRGWSPASGGATATRSAMTQETTIVRKGANAMRVTATAGQNQNHFDLKITDDQVVALRGKTVRAGLWVWVPNISGYDESNRVYFPAALLTSNNGGSSVSSAGLNTSAVRNAWNFITETVTMQSDATSLTVAVYPNKGNTNATGAEFVVVSSITVTDATTPISRQMNDDLIDSPMIQSVAVGGRMVITTQNAPADTGQAYVVGDIAWRSNASVSAQAGWMCTTAGSPGTWTKMPTLGASVPPQAALTYGSTIATNAANGNSFLVTVTNGTAFSMSNPTSLGVSQAGQELIFMFKNTSGGATGVITWGANFHLNGGSTGFTAGATGFNRSIAFLWDGTSLQEIWRGTLDIPN